MDFSKLSMPDVENIIGWAVFIGANFKLIKYQVGSLLKEQKDIKDILNTHGTDIAVIKEQVTSVKGKIENGLSSQIRETSERVARIEGHCETNTQCK